MKKSKRSKSKKVYRVNNNTSNMLINKTKNESIYNKRKKDLLKVHKEDIIENKKDTLKQLTFSQKFPRPYLAKNFLGIPTGIKFSNISKVSKEIGNFSYHYMNPNLLKRSIVCLRRHIRREVLFANKGAGRGKRVSDRRIFTNDSKIKC